MAHRCRTCGDPHFTVRQPIKYPTPEQLARIDAVILDLLEAAREFEACSDDDDPGTPLEFVEWLATDTRRASLHVRLREPAGRPGRSPIDKRLLTSVA